MDPVRTIAAGRERQERSQDWQASTAMTIIKVIINGRVPRLTSTYTWRRRPGGLWDGGEASLSSWFG